MEGWRKIEKNDLTLGLVVKITRIEDGYNIATVIAVGVREGLTDMVRIARPYAYAHEGRDSLQPMLGCEVYEISYDQLMGADSMYHVYEDKRGNLRILDT